MISVKEAKDILSRNCEKGRISEFKLEQSLGKILAEDIHSPMDVPSFDNSAMDGYAMQFHEKYRHWKVSGLVQAGDTESIEVGPGEAVRIFTGAKMPKGADTVIQQELIDKQGNNSIYYNSGKITTGSNVRLKGSQCKKGEKILQKGARITPGIIGLLASVGVSKVAIFTPPLVGCVVTGNELKEVGEQLMDGEIYNSNGPMLEALLKKTGVGEITALRAQDDKNELQQTINKALAENDVLLLSGGISVGDYDFVKECLESAGVKELFYKIKQRPGKPFYAGKKEEKWVFALPGNPASVLSCFNQYVQPCLKTIMGEEQVWQPDLELTLSEETRKKPGFTFFMKGKKEDGKVTLLTGQQSFNLQAFSTADCLVELDEEMAVVPKGTMVKVYNL
ncbi:gephyrin-like molybdotransferase Glp [Salinimicrobium terrae]|uniref:molybdopterin molybdotransferase MoeA n=1 Tax=Salinimicrobium terrae TaxID=470866 RepID=UPI00040D4A3B|nr:gephyrin-like molybdotransferase Glp [Salinimicrobium terrae]